MNFGIHRLADEFLDAILNFQGRLTNDAMDALAEKIFEGVPKHHFNLLIYQAMRKLEELNHDGITIRLFTHTGTMH
jgi:hypothetical protein